LRIQIISSFGPFSNLAGADDSEDYLEEEATRKKRMWYIIDKDSRWKLIWDIMSSMLLLYSYFLTCYSLGFWHFSGDRLGGIDSDSD